MADIDETAGRPEIKIFLSSPGDVNEERILADRVMKRLAERYASVAHLVPIVWEHEPLLATATFQDQIEKPSTTDIVICILWSRLGTRLPAHIQRDDGSRYDSGTEFEFEDAWDAIKRTGRPDLLVYRKMAEPYISLANDHDAEERLHQKRALDGFIQKWFHDQDGSLLAAFHGFSDSAEFEEAFEIHLDKLIARRLDELGVVFTNQGGPVETSGGPRWEGSPFRGLESFEFDHAPIFYGRTQAISKVLKALRGQAASGQSFVMVLGRSGGGKSSLVRAGVLPLLVEPGVVEGVGLWRRAVFRPSDASGNLVEAFAKALTSETALPELLSDGTTVAELADLLSTTPQGADLLLKGALSEAAQKAAFDLAEEAEALARKSHVSEAERAKRKQDVLGNPPQAKLALLVDQLEELFTDEHLAAAERQAFLQAIAALAKSGRVYVLSTLRSDFYQHALDEPILAQLKGSEGQIDLSAPTPAEIGQIIRQPAMRAGLRFEEHPETGARLDDELRDVAVSEPDSLPLLEFTLEELYHRRSPDGVLTWESYESLGGLAGALGRRAEETFLQQSDAARAALPRVMRRIIHMGVGEDQAPTKRPAPLSGFAPNSPERQLVDAFVEARLLVVGSDSAGEPQVALTHEALLSSWPRLKEWLAADRDYLRIRARVNFAADRWEESGRDAQMLLPKGRPLDEARQIYGEADMDLPQSMTSFIAQSIRRATRARRVKQAAVATLAALSILASGAAWYADGQRREAAQARTLSEAAQAQAVQSAAEARAARATAETEQARAEANAIAAQSAQTEAERSAAAAEARLAELFLEQGRQALVAGRVEEATLLLGAAFSGSEKESVGTLFSQARDLAAMRGEEVQVHSGQITAIATSADGKTALASVDGSILVRRQGTGEIVGRHAGDDSALHGLAFSPSGRYLAAGGDGGTVLLWDLQTKIMRPLDGHFQTVFGLSFSDDGGTLVSRSHDKTTRLWRVEDGAELSVIAEPVGSPLAAEYLPKDNRLMTVNSGGLVTIWDVGTGESLQRCSVEFENQIQDAQLYGTGFAVLAMGENGTRRISVSDDCAEIWHNASPSYGLHYVDALTKIGVRHEAGASVLDLSTGQEITRLERANPAAEKSTMIASVVSPDKTLAAILDNEGVLSIHDALGGRAIAEIKAHAAPGSAMAFSDDGAVLITGAADGTATTWHVGALRPCQIDEGTGRAAAFSPDGKYLASGNSKGAVTLVQVETCSKVFSASLATADWVQDILFSADGAYIAVAAGTDVAVLQAGDGREVWSHRFSPEHLVTSLIMQEGLTGLIVGTRVGAPWNNKGGWFELDFATGEILQKSASPENAISRVEIWNDGAYVLSRSRYGLDLWWRHTGARRLQVGYRSVRRVAFFPGKTRMALGDDDGVVRVIRHTRSELFRFKAHDAPISAIAVNSDETLLATAAQDGTAALWNAQTGALIAQMAVQPTEIRAFAFVPGTSFLLSAAADGRVVLWDQTAGTAVSKFDGPAGPRPRLAVSPTGQVFSVSVGNESTRIWPLPTSRVPVDQVSAVISEVTPWGHSVDDALPQDRWQSLALEALASKQADADFVSIETRKQLEMGRLAAVRQDAVSAGRNWGQAPFDAADLPASLSASFDLAMAANSVVLRGLRKVLTEHKERVEHIGFSHDGRWLSSVDWNGRLILWDGSDWTKRLEPEGKFGSDVSFSPDDTRLLASAPYGGLVVLDTEDGSEVLRVAEGHTGQWSADGTQFAVFPRLGPPIVFDATTGAVVARFTTLGSDGSGFSLSPDLKTLAVGTEAGVALLDTVSRAEAALVSPPRTTDEDRPDLLFSRFSPDGKRIAVIWTDNTGAVFDVESKERLFDLPADALYVQFGKSVDRILVSQKKRKVSLIDSSDGSILEKLDGDLPSNGAFQAGETLFAILDGGAKSIQLHGVETGRYHGSYINHATSWLRLVTSPDEKTRVSVSGDGALLIWDIQDDVGPLRPSETSFEAWQEGVLAEHSDGGALVQLGSNAALRVDGQVSSLLSGHAGRVTAGAITQDGDRVLTGGEGGKVLIWNRETLQLQRTIPNACSKPVAAVLPTVDNAGLWVHCEDGALRLIDMERGEPLIAFMAKPADTSKPGRMAFSDDGKSLELRGSDGPYLWQIAP